MVRKSSSSRSPTGSTRQRRPVLPLGGEIFRRPRSAPAGCRASAPGSVRPRWCHALAGQQLDGGARPLPEARRGNWSSRLGTPVRSAKRCRPGPPSTGGGNSSASRLARSIHWASSPPAGPPGATAACEISDEARFVDRERRAVGLSEPEGTLEQRAWTSVRSSTHRSGGAAPPTGRRRPAPLELDAGGLQHVRLRRGGPRRLSSRRERSCPGRPHRTTSTDACPAGLLPAGVSAASSEPPPRGRGTMFRRGRHARSRNVGPYPVQMLGAAAGRESAFCRKPGNSLGTRSRRWAHHPRMLTPLGQDRRRRRGRASPSRTAATNYPELLRWASPACWPW